MPATQELKLENIVGCLAETLPQVDQSTIQHAAQIVTEQRNKPELRTQLYWSADFTFYGIETIEGKEEVMLYMGEGKHNLMFRNIQDADAQLSYDDHNYRPKNEDIESVINAESTLRIKLSDLRLKGKGYDCKYLEIDVTNYGTLNDAERKLAERVYDQGDKFVKNMRSIADRDITSTRIYVLTSEYVRWALSSEHMASLPEAFRDRKTIARAARLGDFGNGARFGAGEWRVGGAGRTLRGVRSTEKEVAAGPAPENAELAVSVAYKIILGNPEKAVQAMTPLIAVGLRGILAAYDSQHPDSGKKSP